jgi:hypothetical protein
VLPTRTAGISPRWIRRQMLERLTRATFAHSAIVINGGARVVSIVSPVSMDSVSATARDNVAAPRRAKMAVCNEESGLPGRPRASLQSSSHSEIVAVS